MVGGLMRDVRMVAWGAKFWKCERWKILLYKNGFFYKDDWSLWNTKRDVAGDFLIVFSF